eukprot:CAMPEP_0172838482 /NCGR_PEP_ID=MMETSP1075-20121228/27907_1 /TAXON_ID=2916 /ORGANISM="Ceratium fusus, Strain PA161109" /LENGTH=136 /DNA_ID=CAMNT_0013682005 /DNA_START=163 /DNA_END=572 /DNA_ORIENTATION=+
MSGSSNAIQWLADRGGRGKKPACNSPRSIVAQVSVSPFPIKFWKLEDLGCASQQLLTRHQHREPKNPVKVGVVAVTCQNTGEPCASPRWPNATPLRQEDLSQPLLIVRAIRHEHNIDLRSTSEENRQDQVEANEDH